MKRAYLRLRPEKNKNEKKNSDSKGLNVDEITINLKKLIC